jgi:hypothetical protein
MEMKNEQRNMTQIAEKKQEGGKQITCADLSLESLSTFIFAKRTMYNCIMRLKGLMKETHLVFPFSKSFNPFVSIRSASLTNSRCLFGKCLKY